MFRAPWFPVFYRCDCSFFDGLSYMWFITWLRADWMLCTKTASKTLSCESKVFTVLLTDPDRCQNICWPQKLRAWRILTSKLRFHCLVGQLQQTFAPQTQRQPLVFHRPSGCFEDSCPRLLFVARRQFARKAQKQSYGKVASASYARRRSTRSCASLCELSRRPSFRCRAEEGVGVIGVGRPSR